jgi:hypothetical protein
MKVCEFIVGQEYEMMESCGCVTWKGIYVGMGDYQGDSSDDNLLVFKSNDNLVGSYQYAAAKPEFFIRDNQVFVNFRTCYYGNSVEELRPAHSAHRKVNFKLKS